MEDRSKRTETVRPPLNERCERRQECDSVLSATNDEKWDLSDGEADDEEMEGRRRWDSTKGPHR